jgi:uncharacterized membrane protein YeaQ/YmgE (transglycosylase-associated protein family)
LRVVVAAAVAFATFVGRGDRFEQSAHTWKWSTQMGIIGWIVFGLIVGAIAKLVMPGRDPGGILVTMLLGMVGALLGGFLGRALGLYGPDDAAGFLMSTLGAVVVLWIYRLAVGRRAVAH